MQIKRLELAGFKSFMNPVALDFGGGITAILGPNGCGKSNVVDAIRWVLGEQSAKQLRGEKMQNVLFNGTRARKPLGLASVSVSFSNNQGRLPVEYEDVTLTRRLTRDGQSDYLLNGTPCRLKDIKDLITDTGAGSHGYAIIERDQVDLVVNDHEDSRRFLFEEASGIMKYRLRRKEALRKLELTEQDMLRLNDIIEEIGRQVRSLRRQMGRARRYQELQQRLRRAETWLAQQRLAEYHSEAAALQAQLEGFAASGFGDDATGDAIAARIEALRTDLVGIEHGYRDAGTRCDSITAQLKADEDSMLVLRERSESARESRAAAEGEVQVTTARLEQVRLDRERLEQESAAHATRLEAERDNFRTRKDELSDCEEKYEQARGELLQVKQRSFDFVQDSAARRGEIDLLRARIETQDERARELREDLDVEAARIARLTEEHADVGARVEAAAAACDDRRAALTDVDRQLVETSDRLEARREEKADLGSRLEATRSRHELLHAMIEAYEGYGDGARALLQRHAASGRVLGTLADQLDVPAGLEAAFDVLLHDVVDALVVRDLDGAVDLVRELRGERLGRATLLSPAGGDDVDLGDVQAWRERPGVVGVASELLPETGATALVRRFLARAVVVEDVAAARDLLAVCRDASLRIATRDGFLFTGAGAVSGGSERDRDVHLLGRRQRLAELEEEMRVVTGEISQVASSLSALEASLQALREQRVRLESALRSEDEQYREVAVQRATLETSIAEASARRAQAGAVLAQLDAEIAAGATRLPELESDAERLGQEGDLQTRALAEQERLFGELERERERLRVEVGECRVRFVTLQGEVESQQRQLERLGELERELFDLCTRRQDEIARADRDLERYAGELGMATASAGLRAGELEAARAAMAEVALQLDAQRAAIDAEQERLREIERARREQQGKRHAVEMSLSECTLRRQNLLDRIEEQYGLQESELLGLTFAWTDDDPVPDETHVRTLRDDIARIGPVNLLALEEYEEKSTRLRFLETQRDDLVKASAALTETIDKINRTAHFLFTETFEQIRAHFLETIRTVFDGGEGDLRLANPEDPLESDIEILVRPRGKRIDTLTQLSSGERALTAIALLFSIYLVKPSPFCVFDEVDAPLDDANVGRFVNLLQEFKHRTQFIVITHNKLTMEAADRLYGVTMEEEGVSKLVSVALDGEVRGQPRALRKKTERVRRAAALLQPSEAALAGTSDTAPPAAFVFNPAPPVLAGTAAELRGNAAEEAVVAAFATAPEPAPDEAWPAAHVEPAAHFAPAAPFESAAEHEPPARRAPAARLVTPEHEVRPAARVVASPAHDTLADDHVRDAAVLEREAQLLAPDSAPDGLEASSLSEEPLV